MPCGHRGGGDIDEAPRDFKSEEKARAWNSRSGIHTGLTLDEVCQQF
jgi:hypothetical protein